MKTICVDPVTAALLCVGHLSFVTVDRPPPDGWIGQRVAIYADPTILPTRGRLSGLSVEDYDNLTVSLDAIVGSGTLAEVLPIRRFGECDLNADVRHICVDGSTVMLIDGDSDDDVDLSVLFRLQSWEPGRWALRLTDVTPTIPCPDCNGDGIDGSDDAARFYAYSGKFSTCDTCDGMGTVSAPIVGPVLSGDDPTYKEWLSGQKENQHE